MSQSRAAVYCGQPGCLELRSYPTPQPRGEEVLVRVLGCTLCGSDLHTAEGRRAAETPLILGHEIVGQIEVFGSRARRQDLAGRLLLEGDRITWSLAASCGSCFFCDRQLPQKCERLMKYGHQAATAGRELRGGLAEHCLLEKGTALVKLPEDLPLEAACPANCATATVMAAVEAADIVPGMTVGVIGCGMLGLTAVAVCQSFGAPVLAVDPQPARRQWAQRLGAVGLDPAQAGYSLSAANQGHGVDVLLEISGSSAAFSSLWPTLRIGGVAVLIGAVFPSDPIPLQMESLVRRQQTLKGVHNYAPQHLLAAVNFLAAQHLQLPLSQLVSHWRPLEEAAAAIRDAADPASIRVGVRPA